MRLFRFLRKKANNNATNIESLKSFSAPLTPYTDENENESGGSHRFANIKQNTIRSFKSASRKFKQYSRSPLTGLFNHGQDDEAGESDESDEADEADEAGESDESDEADEAGEAGESDESDEADEAGEAGESDESDEAGDSDESDEDEVDESDEAYIEAQKIFKKYQTFFNNIASDYAGDFHSKRRLLTSLKRIASLKLNEEQINPKIDLVRVQDILEELLIKRVKFYRKMGNNNGN